MAEDRDNLKESTSIIDEIENQLENILKRKKEAVEKELEEKIELEKQEAKNRMEEIDRELTKEKDSLISYQKLLSEFESDKLYLKQQIKGHLDKVVEIQNEIEAKTTLTLDELEKVSGLHKRMEELNRTTHEKVITLKEDLKKKFGITAQIPESVEEEEVKSQIQRELDRLHKIKDLLSASESLEIDVGVAEETDVEASEEEVVEPEEPGPVQDEPKPEIEEIGEESAEVEVRDEEAPPEKAEQEKVAEEEKPTEPVEDVTSEIEGLRSEIEDLGLLDTLEQYRRSEGVEGEGEISYFEHEDRQTLDGEYIVAAVFSSVEEAKKLYIKLTQTESPKEQFFVKQEIIKHQEAVRKLMLSCIRMCERDPEFLPSFTKDILNVDEFKLLLEKVSMENWSNQEDFTAFDEHAKNLKDKFYERITPPAEYLQSIIRELKIQSG